MKKYALAALLAAIGGPALAAPAPLPNVSPAMWVVKDNDTTVYLFGTFHMLDGKRDWFNDEVKTAFDGSSELVLEAVMPKDPSKLQPLVMKYAVDPKGRTLSQKLTPAVKTRLDAALADIGIPANALDPLEPWFVTMTLTGHATSKLGLKPEHGPEKALADAAKAKGMAVGELEGFESQIAMLDSMGEAEQVKGMEKTLEELSKLGETLTPMLNAWSSGDTEGLVRILNVGFEKQPELYKRLFTDRNVKWADWIGQRMEKPGTVFIAVGAGHLAGKGSVQEYLAKKGLKASRVKG